MSSANIVPASKPKRGPGSPKGTINNPNGRTRGSKNALTTMKMQLVAKTGMMPLDFLVAVYRDELFDDYEEFIMEDRRTVAFRKKPNAKKIPVTLNQRIQAATCAAPYMHKRMPIGVEVRKQSESLISADRLRSMSDAELEQLASFMEVLGIEDLGVLGEGSKEVAGERVTQFAEGEAGE